MKKEICANCGSAIGDLETPYIWKEGIVCNSCYTKLQPKKVMLSKKIILVTTILVVITIIGGGAIWLANSKGNHPIASENQLKTLAALKRLQAKVEIGMNFRDFSDALANAWADAKPLMETPDPMANPHFEECLTEAMDNYKAAKENWSQIIDPQEDDQDRKLEIQAAQIAAMHEGRTKDLAALDNETQIERKKIIDETKNKLKRLCAFEMADDYIAKAEAILARDDIKEAQLQVMISKLQADLQVELNKWDKK